MAKNIQQHIKERVQDISQEDNSLLVAKKEFRSFSFLARQFLRTFDPDGTPKILKLLETQYHIGTEPEKFGAGAASGAFDRLTKRAFGEIPSKSIVETNITMIEKLPSHIQDKLIEKITSDDPNEEVSSRLLPPLTDADESAFDDRQDTEEE